VRASSFMVVGGVIFSGELFFCKCWLYMGVGVGVGRRMGSRGVLWHGMACMCGKMG
jgi:hypothetical protein